MNVSTNTVNAANAPAYSLTDENALAQYASTGMINNHGSAKTQVDTARLLELAALCSDKYVAQTAVYAQQCGYMRTTPIILLAYLSAQEDKYWFNTAFDILVTNVGQLRRFTSIIRSGVVGKKNVSSSANKRAVQRFFNRTDSNRLFWQSVGSDPSLADVIRLTHPKPDSPEKDAFFGYLLGKDFIPEDLPQKVKNFEEFKALTDDQHSGSPPDVPFAKLTALNLSTDQWETVFRNMTWNQLRKNINTAQRKGLFERPSFVTWMAAKIRDPKHVYGSKVLPLSLIPTKLAVQTAPPELQKAVDIALELSLVNAPKLDGNVTLIVDTSGSMGQPINREAYSSQNIPRTSYMDVAAIFGTALLKANVKNCTLLPVDTRVHSTEDILPTHSLYEAASTLISKRGGGTNMAAGLQHILAENQKGIAIPDLVIIISDNESWFDHRGRETYRYRHTVTKAVWNQIQAINPEAKLVCWNIAPELTTQAPDNKNIFNIGGYSDAVFDLIANFYTATTPHYWSNAIKALAI